MSSKISISIPKPCHENWQKMSPLEKGRFCDSCQKQVFDFTKSSDREILRKFNSEKDVCGRILSTRLEKDIYIPKEKSTIWIAGASGILSFLSLGNQESFSQEVKTEQTDYKPVDVDKEYSRFSSDSKIKISGHVTDEIGPLGGASIVNINNNDKTVTDIDGNFTISAAIDDEISIKIAGYKGQVVKIQSTGELSIIMKPDELEEVVVVGMIAVTERRTFFGRIFRSIGNIFR